MKFKFCNRIKAKNYGNLSNDYIWVAMCVLWDWKVGMQRMEFIEESMCEPSKYSSMLLDLKCPGMAISPLLHSLWKHVKHNDRFLSTQNPFKNDYVTFQKFHPPLISVLKYECAPTKWTLCVRVKTDTMSFECNDFIITLKWQLSKAM